MKPLTIILLFICSLAYSQKETSYTVSIDSYEQSNPLLDSLLKTYTECEIFVITKVEEKKVYIKRLCDKRGKSTPIKKTENEVFEVGNYFTLLNEFNSLIL